MANHLQDILSHWFPARAQLCWVLGTVIAIDGSNYRKIGAMLLANELGHYYGLISGGCLEKALLTEVKKVLTFQRPLRVCYDSSEDSDSPWAKALGCGGKVTVLLQPLTAENHYQSLDRLYAALHHRSPARYAINLTGDVNRLLTEQEIQALNLSAEQAYRHLEVNHQQFLVLTARAQIHLVVFGGGVDAVPLIKMADVLGWRVTLVDERAGYAQPHQFASARILRAQAQSPEVANLLTTVDAAMVMTHNLDLDAAAVRALQYASARYIGLLGPLRRKHKVLTLAALSQQTVPIYGPMGLPLGGDLPEAVALSALAQCQQVLEANPSRSAAPRHSEFSDPVHAQAEAI